MVHQNLFVCHPMCFWALWLLQELLAAVMVLLPKSDLERQMLLNFSLFPNCFPFVSQGSLLVSPRPAFNSRFTSQVLQQLLMPEHYGCGKPGKPAVQPSPLSLVVLSHCDIQARSRSRSFHYFVSLLGRCSYTPQVKTWLQPDLL